jgi:hypothetical protein
MTILFKVVEEAGVLVPVALTFLELAVVPVDLGFAAFPGQKMLSFENHSI